MSIIPSQLCYSVNKALCFTSKIIQVTAMHNTHGQLDHTTNVILGSDWLGLYVCVWYNTWQGRGQGIEDEGRRERWSEAAGQKCKIERQCQLSAVIREWWNMLRWEVSAGSWQGGGVFIWPIYCVVVFFPGRELTLVSDGGCNAHYVVW